VATNFQTAGKGQGKKTWQSNKGENILASFYFQPAILPPQQIYFNYFFALTIRKVISLFVETRRSSTTLTDRPTSLQNHNVMIKKPNDIWVDDKKIAGILIEHHIQGEKLKYSVAGIGININQIQFDEKLPNPTSLKLITKENLSREKILQEIVQIGRKYYNKLQNGAFIELENEYESYIKNVKIEEKTD
jgi:BirA family biotin operon repressor/biotin-[acetyl-CoA-carboxylase] ligase